MQYLNLGSVFLLLVYLLSQMITSIHLSTIPIMAHFIHDTCIACGSCIDECPTEAISEGDIYKIDPDACIDCGNCAEVCPTDSIEAQ